jgi:hypothetical protein
MFCGAVIASETIHSSEIRMGGESKMQQDEAREGKHQVDCSSKSRL